MTIIIPTILNQKVPNIALWFCGLMVTLNLHLKMSKLTLVNSKITLVIVQISMLISNVTKVCQIENFLCISFLSKTCLDTMYYCEPFMSHPVQVYTHYYARIEVFQSCFCPTKESVIEKNGLRFTLLSSLSKRSKKTIKTHHFSFLLSLLQ